MMASAMMGGLLDSGVAPAQIICSDAYAPCLEKAAAKGIHTTANNADVVAAADVIVIAVKPYIVAKVLAETASILTADKLLVCIAAGITIGAIEEHASAARVVRTMPNTPALVGEAAVGYALGTNATDADGAIVEALFRGVVVKVEEKHLNAVTALSGSGPAYVFLFIEALADAGVRAGLSRTVALKLAAQTVRGSATMQLETGKHPGVLKDQVTSPGGTTIAGVEALEKNGFRYAAMSAVAAANARCIELGK
jgi:pyrroline-5-carboxylate reductase